MFNYIEGENKITTKRRLFFVIFGVVAAGMCASGVNQLIELIRYAGEDRFSDLIGIPFMCIWCLIAAWMSLFGFRECSKQLTITSEGVTCSTFLSRRTWTWPEIIDWGVAYGGNDRGSTIYYLYFSKQENSITKKGRKKLRGKTFKCMMSDDDLGSAKEILVPFCRRYTSVAPFISEE